MVCNVCPVKRSGPGAAGDGREKRREKWHPVIRPCVMCVMCVMTPGRHCSNVNQNTRKRLFHVCWNWVCSLSWKWHFHQDQASSITAKYPDTSELIIILHCPVCSIRSLIQLIMCYWHRLGRLGERIQLCNIMINIYITDNYSMSLHLIFSGCVSISSSRSATAADDRR